MSDLVKAARRLAFELSEAGVLDVQTAPEVSFPRRDFLIKRAALDCLSDLGTFGLAIDEDEGEISIYVSKRITSAHRQILPETYGDAPLNFDFEKIVSINPSRLKPRELTTTPLANNIVRCGDSIGPGNDRSAGTLGALVRERNGDGSLFGLTCNHVIGGCNNMPRGMPIVSPGIIDVVKTTQKLQMIGRHARVAPLRQGQASVFSSSDNIDAALFAIEDPDLVSSTQRGEYDTPTEILDPTPGMQLRKVGRTTDLRKGRIKSRLEHPIPVDYAYKIPIDHKTTKSFQGVCTFGNAWIVDPYSSAFAAPGDSGSLVVDVPEDPKQLPRAVGLLFAATSKGKGYILPIRDVLDTLEVDLVSNHNVY